MRVVLSVSVAASYILYIYRRVLSLKFSRLFIFSLIAIAPAFLGAEIMYVKYLTLRFCETDSLMLNITTVKFICSYKYGPLYFVLSVVAGPLYFFILGLSWFLIERGIIPFIAPEFSL